MKSFRGILTALFSAVALMCHAEGDIEWLETVHNFGAFDENNGSVTCDFKFVNRSEEPVSVIAVRTSCGCTTSKPPRDLVMPGDTASVSATYDPTGRPGRFEKRIYVETTGEPRKSTLTIKGVVIGASNTLRSRYPVDAGALKLRGTKVTFGEVTKGRIKSEFFEVYNATEDTIRPQWENLPTHIRVASSLPAVPPGEQMAYALIFDTTRCPLYGVVTDSFAMRSSADAEPVEIESVGVVVEDFSEVSGEKLQKAPRIRVDDDRLDFGVFDRTDRLSRKFTISNLGRDALKIRRVYTMDRGVSVMLDKDTVKRGKHATVTVNVDPAQLPAELLNARIIVISNDPLDSTMMVRAVGELRQEP